MRAVWALGVLAAVSVSAAWDLRVTEPAKYSTMCDASAAAAVDSDRFVVANDEDNLLRIYRNDRPGRPVDTVNLAAFLSLHGRFPETDLEGAARVGDRIFWISSHGRSRLGKERENRHCFLATDIKYGSAGSRIEPAGRPYKGLLLDLETDARLVRFNLSRAATLAPRSSGALNIEGLSATPEGHLLIGFRNPVPGGKALLVPLLNPNDVISGRSAKLGDPIRLDLGGCGVRDIAYARGAFWIIAGQADGSGHSRLYRWVGGSASPERLHVKRFGKYNPEAIVVYPERLQGPIQFLSDDGARATGGTPCKKLQDTNARSFRSFWVQLNESPAGSTNKPASD